MYGVLLRYCDRTVPHFNGVYSAAIVMARNAYARRAANGLCFPVTRYRRLSGDDDWHLCLLEVSKQSAQKLTGASNGRLLSF